MRILLVEDDVTLASELRKRLVEQGLLVNVSHDGNDGRHLAVQCDYDLVILGVMLPGEDGFSLLAHIRRSKLAAILMLTACDDVADRVRGLQQGADDYLLKPFAFSELVARIRALLRRSASSQVDPMCFA